MDAQSINTDTIPSFDMQELHHAIREKYGEVARNPSCSFHFTTGRVLAKRLGYTGKMLNRTPSEAIASFAGVGNPFMVKAIQPGMSILDIGSGAGMDALIAATLVGPTGVIHGIDLTNDMVVKARQNALKMACTNTFFRQASAEQLPFKDHTFDTVISNGVINLCPDKAAVYREIHRVLKPGGTIQLADVMLSDPVPADSRDLIHLWTDCVAGAVPEVEYISMVERCGFKDLLITTRFDVFEGARFEPSARRFGAFGANISGKRM